MRKWRVRLFVVLLAGAVIGLVAWAGFRAKPTVVRIGIVPFAEVNSGVVSGFKEAMEDFDFLDRVTVHYRLAPADGDIRQLPHHIGVLLDWEPDLLLVSSTPPSQAAYRATLASAIPIVFAPVSEPLGAQIVDNLRRPGRHATGVRLAPSNGLRLQWFKRMAPRIRNVYVPYSSDDASALATIEQIRPAADELKVRLLLRPVADPAQIIRAAHEIPEGTDAIFLPQDSRIESAIDAFIEAAMAQRLPLSVPAVLEVERGALMSYGFDHLEIGRQAARLAVEILAGTPPGDLPVETAVNRLHVNQRTARAIGLEIDASVLRQADRVVH